MGADFEPNRPENNLKAKKSKQKQQRIQINSRREQFLNLRHYPIAGADEAGRGALAGPLTVAMVILRFPLHSFLKQHLNDSKQVSASMREELFSCIAENALSYAVSSIKNSVIDRKRLTASASLALWRCYKKMSVKPRGFLLDKGLKMPSSFPSVLLQFSLIRGDEKSFSIAAASIMAKVTRDRIMKRLHFHGEGLDRYNFASNKGYAVKEHLRVLEEHGVSKFHRRSYAPVFRALAQFSGKS